MSKRIEIEIAEDGATTIEAVGYLGGECRLATEPFEQATGVVKERKIKSADCQAEEKVKVR